MAKPKFRLFGGPNGSGKTTLFKKFRKEKRIHTEIYVNADRIELQLKKSRSFNFNAYRVKTDYSTLLEHIAQSGLFKTKIRNKDFLNHFELKRGILHIDRKISVNSYHASFVASYLALQLFESGQSFAYETVMSHESKVDVLQIAKAFGYKTYLYFIFLDNIETNVVRVKVRAAAGEHDVPDDIIRSRSIRTFKLLPIAFVAADSAYIIDNSNEATVVVSKENNKIIVGENIPTIIKDAITTIAKKEKS